MNNNWAFNNFKNEDDEEIKENEPVIEKIEPPEEIPSSNNFNNSKKTALYKLLIGFGFLLALIIFMKFSNSQSNDEILDNSTKTTTIQPSNVDKTMLNKLKNNIYTYNIVLNYKTLKEEKTINYDFLVKGNETIILKTENDKLKKYYVNDNKYYIINDNKNSEVSDSEIFDNFDKKYFDLNNIYSYVEDGVLEWKTIYKDKTDRTNYSVYLKDILLTSDTEKYISITIDNREENTLYLEIDWTNLFNNLYDNVQFVKSNMKYELVSETNISEIEKKFA